jgi:hypothetical protein
LSSSVRPDIDLNRQALKLRPEPTGLFCVFGAPALFATQGAQLK